MASVINQTTTADSQLWFIPIDIIGIVCCVLTIVLTIIFLSLIIYDKRCHTVSMMLVANSCLCEFLFSIALLIAILIVLENDRKRTIQYENACFAAGYISYVACGTQNYSYLVQAIYRYVLVVYPNHLIYQSAKFQLFIISLMWICGIIYPIPFLLTNQIQYDYNDHVCQMPFQFSFVTLFNVIYIYLLPMGLVMLIYFLMIRYVRQISRNVTTANRLFRVQRELRMTKRIVLLVLITVSLGIPYTLFMFMSFFGRPQKNQFRIAYLFINISLVLIMITLFIVTEPLRASFNKIRNRQLVTVVPVV